MPRRKLEATLRRNLRSGQNTAVHGPRRIGKTSLVHNVAHSIKHLELVYADFLLASDPADVAERIAKAALEAANRKGFLESAMKAMARLRPTMSFDHVSGAPTFSLSAEARASKSPESVEQALDVLLEVSKSRKLAVLFDEFQGVLKADPSGKTIAAMRSRIQFHDRIPYVFAGSDRTRMSEIFTDSESPFYKSAMDLSVDSIPGDEFWDFIERRFASGKVALDPGFRLFVEQTGIETPGDLQQLCSFVWSYVRASGRKKATSEDAADALEDILKAENDPFERLADAVSPVQLKLLRSIARLGGESIYSQEFLQASGIRAPGTLTRAANQLLSQKILRKTREGWFIENPFFRLWLARI